MPVPHHGLIAGEKRKCPPGRRLQVPVLLSEVHALHGAGVGDEPRVPGPGEFRGGLAAGGVHELQLAVGAVVVHGGGADGAGALQPPLHRDGDEPCGGGGREARGREDHHETSKSRTEATSRPTPT